MKRSTSAETDIGEDASSSAMHLKAQNRSLSIEMLRYKRQLSEARKELDMIRGKSREMESLLDIDVSMLLDGFGDSEQLAEAGGNTELLYRLIHAGSEFHARDPTDVTGLPKMDVDEWSTAEDIEKARASAERRLNIDRSGGTIKEEDPGESSSSSSSSSRGHNKSKKETDVADEEQINLMDIECGGKVEETLGSHAAFTLALIERLCFILSDTGVVQHLPDSLGAIADAKGLHAEIFVLKDRITKLSGNILDLEARLLLCEKQKKAAERALDKSTVERAEAVAIGISSSSSSSASAMTVTHPIIAPDGSQAMVDGVTTEGGGVTTIITSTNNIDPEADAELRRKITILEKQLSESETAKAKAEMTLTERLARPLSQTEAQVADMRRAMEDLRHQGRQRVAALITEGIALQDRVADLEAALVQVEAISKAKCNEMAVATAAEIQRVEGEKKAAESALFSARAELAMTNQLKQQVSELQSLEAAARNDSARAQQHLAGLATTQEQLHRHLAAARARELALEQKLGIAHQITDIDALIAQGGGSGSSGNNNDDPSLAEIRQLTLTQAQTRASETQLELDDARAQMNDLILEIDAVTVEDGKSREQSERLLRQMTESQSMQRGVLDENLRLHDQIAELHRKQGEEEMRIEHLQVQMKTQDAVISQLRSAENAARNEIQALRKTHSDEHSQRILNEQLVVEAEQKLKLAEHSAELAKKRNTELQTRCDELAGQVASERKIRMEAQRETRPKVPKRDKKDDNKASGSSGGSGDSDMLDLTMGMLKCSVCKDRFKDCVITRCFHLFCKDCIDDLLRNRHRKCPACGEKFGQDDVKSVFFTH